MREEVTLPLKGLSEEPYASIVCYPRCKYEELQSRLRELELQGVVAIEFTGKANAFNVPVLGKGYVGIVVAAQRYKQRIALKMRRVDADRTDLFHEARMLEIANSASVGPALVNVSKNFLLMELIEGSLLPAWLKENPEATIVRNVLHELLEQCWQLDLTGVDHGELSKAPKHIIVDTHLQPWIVDFETASNTRKPANVTAICQYLFMSLGPLPKTVAEILGNRNRETMIRAIKDYKKERTQQNFDELVKACLY